MAPNFLNLRREMNVKILKNSKNSKQDKPKKIYSNVHYNEILKSHRKERSPKASIEKLLAKYKKAPHRSSVHFSKEILQTRREWDYIFKVCIYIYIYYQSIILSKYMYSKHWKKKLSTKNAISNKTVLQIIRNQDFPR